MYLTVFLGHEIINKSDAKNWCSKHNMMGKLSNTHYVNNQERMCILPLSVLFTRSSQVQKQQNSRVTMTM